MRVFRTPYNEEFEAKRGSEIEECQNMGFPAFVKDVDPEKFVGANPASVGTLQLSEVRTRDEIKNDVELTPHERHHRAVFLTGQVAGAIKEIKPAKDIVEMMVQQAAYQLDTASTFVISKL